MPSNLSQLRFSFICIIFFWMNKCSKWTWVMNKNHEYFRVPVLLDSLLVLIQGLLTRDTHKIWGVNDGSKHYWKLIHIWDYNFIYIWVVIVQKYSALGSAKVKIQKPTDNIFLTDGLKQERRNCLKYFIGFLRLCRRIGFSPVQKQINAFVYSGVSICAVFFPFQGSISSSFDEQLLCQ